MHPDTSQEAINSGFYKIVSNYEELIKKIQNEIDVYRHEQESLRENVTRILKENQEICAEINRLRPPEITNPTEKHIKLTNQAIDNLKTQIRQLNEERDTIHMLWKTSQETVSTLENEIANYRNQIVQPNSVAEIKIKYDSTIHLLENTIQSLKAELVKQTNINKELLENKQGTEKNLKSVENKCVEQETTIDQHKDLEKSNLELQERLSIALKANIEFEKSLNTSKQIISERFCREREALSKVQEALRIAEAAVLEKEEALKNEKIVRDECNNLAKTIGQVVEEAANKVDENLTNMKAQYEQQIKVMRNENNDTKSILENQTKLTEIAEAKGKILETKLKEVVKENMALDSDLQVASQAIIEMELKINAIEKLVDKEDDAKKNFEEREEELKSFVISSIQLKKGWKAAFEEATEKFQKEIRRLCDENNTLQIENHELKLKLHKFN